jgi:hypothetical protein
VSDISNPQESYLGKVLFRRVTSIRSIVERNPAGFETKFDQNPSSLTTLGLNSAGLPGSLSSATSSNIAHKLGCKCRKSRCLKKYCECYHRSAKCSVNCRCIDCHNGGTNNSAGSMSSAAGYDNGMMLGSVASDTAAYHYSNSYSDSYSDSYNDSYNDTYNDTYNDYYTNSYPNHNVGGYNDGLDDNSDEDDTMVNGVWMVDAAMELSFLKRSDVTDVADVTDASTTAAVPSTTASASSNNNSNSSSNNNNKDRSGTPSPTTTTASSTNSSILNSPIKPPPVPPHLSAHSSTQSHDTQSSESLMHDTVADSMMAAALAMTELYSQNSLSSTTVSSNDPMVLPINTHSNKSPKRRAQSIVRSESSGASSCDDESSTNTTNTEYSSNGGYNGYNNEESYGSEEDGGHTTGQGGNNNGFGGRLLKRPNVGALSVDTSSRNAGSGNSGITPSVILGVGGMKMDVR